ncbi:unnamed protein product [Arctia plantaginis]|uniref:Uncharacterized protein n=1 Tax=Arctia plantaginis TaxID=874455 RepID=A0A8S1A8V4_ARCPL|nr:unnamed protein product [Arctia plantaginis]CAB3243665.1 unnamed protein product [Arctia plantaginis]
MIALKLFIFAFVATVVIADVKPVAEIITEHTIVNPDGYSFDFKSNDGISRQEEGKLITVNDKVGIAISGTYSYPGPDGEQYEVTFTADDKGYKPQIRVLPAGQR